MTLYGYCVRAAGDPAPPEELTGVGGAAVRALREGPLELWVSEGDPGPASEQGLREHERVTRAALRSATPLPLRYGTARFADEAAARAALREHRAEWAAALERLAGRVEMGVRVGWEPPDVLAVPAAAPEPEPARGPGRAYLEARRRELAADAELRRAADAVLDRVQAHMEPLGLPTVRSALPAPGTAGILAHLVHRAEVGRYRGHVELLRESMPGHSLAVTGPWAPYSFV